MALNLLVVGLLTIIIVHPVDLIRTKMVCDNENKYKSAWDCYTKVTREVGHTGLYSGLWLNILTFLPPRLLYFEGGISFSVIGSHQT